MLPCRFYRKALARRADPSALFLLSNRQPFALNDEFIALRKRVHSLESLVFSLINSHPLGRERQHLEGAAFLPYPQPPSGPVSGDSASPLELGVGPSTNGMTALRRASKSGKEEEDVAAVLQQLSEGSGGVEGEVGGAAPTSVHGVRCELSDDIAHNTDSSSQSLQNPPILSNGPSGLASVGSPELDALLALVPPRPVCDYLLDSFIHRADWWLHVSSRSPLRSRVRS
jgi:hypothetical protein